MARRFKGSESQTETSYYVTPPSPYTGQSLTLNASKTTSRERWVDDEFRLNVNGITKPFLHMPYTYNHRQSMAATGQYRSYGAWRDLTAKTPSMKVDWDLSSADLASNAARQFYSRALDRAGRNFNLGVALAESKDTVGLVASAARRMARSMFHLRRGRIKDAFHTLGISDNTRVPVDMLHYNRQQAGKRGIVASQHIKDLSRRRTHVRKGDEDGVKRFAGQAWLEMRYGWSPLVYDVYNGAQAAAYLLNDRTLKHLSLEGSSVCSGQSRVYSGWVTKTFDIDNYKVHKISCDYVIDDPVIYNTSALGLDNPALILWEKVPYSFVFDWFLPVGDFLASFSALNGLKQIDGSVSVLTKELYEFDRYNQDGGNWKYYYYNHTRGFVNNVSFTRTLSGTPSVPFPKFSLFERMNGERYLDAMALMRQAFY